MTNKVADWHDPEFLPPRGQGCWLCHLAPPVVMLDHTALCLRCLGGWWPGQPLDMVMDWLERQTSRRIAWAEGAECRLEADKRNLAAWLRSAP